jgi:hypothetical protein
MRSEFEKTMWHWAPNQRAPESLRDRCRLLAGMQSLAHECLLFRPRAA